MQEPAYFLVVLGVSLPFGPAPLLLLSGLVPAWLEADSPLEWTSPLVGSTQRASCEIQCRKSHDTSHDTQKAMK